MLHGVQAVIAVKKPDVFQGLDETLFLPPGMVYPLVTGYALFENQIADGCLASGVTLIVM